MSFEHAPFAASLRYLQSKSARAILLAAFAPFTFGVLTVVLGLIGWSQRLFDGSLHSFAVVIFRSLGDFTVSPKNFEDGNAVSDASAVFGLLTVYSSAAVILASIFRERRRKMVARHVLRRHHLIIGDSALARRVGAIWGETVDRTLRVAPPSAPTPDFLQRVVRHAYDESLTNVFALSRARRVFFDLDDDARTIALVLQAFSSVTGRPLTRRRGSPREWICVVRDDTFADHLEATLGMLRAEVDEEREPPRILLLRPDRLIAQEAIAKSCLFRSGRNTRTHALVVGYGSVAKHLVENILDRAPADQPTPLITVLTSRAVRDRRRFSSLRPLGDKGLDVAFLEIEALEDLSSIDTPDGRLLLAQDAASPFTQIFLTSDKPRDSVLSRIFIYAIQRKIGRLTCPIFSRTPENGDVESLLPVSSAGPGSAGLIQFGLSDDFLRAYLCEPGASGTASALSSKSVDVLGT